MFLDFSEYRSSTSLSKSMMFPSLSTVTKTSNVESRFFPLAKLLKIKTLDKSETSTSSKI